MTDYNGFSFTNESSGDTLHNPDSFLNPTNGLDDNNATDATLSFTSTGDDEKAFGTTFSSKSIGAIYAKVSTNLGASASAYVNKVLLQKYTGTTWVTLTTLKNVNVQTLSFEGVISNVGTCEGLRLYFDTESSSGDTISLTVTDFTYAETFTYTPKYLLSELGGTALEDLGDMTALAEDHTITWQALVRQAILIAENAVRTLQANNVSTNGPNIVVDEFVVSNGTKNTVNTGTSTAYYNSTSDYYELIEKETESSPAVASSPSNEETSMTISGSITSSKGYFSSVGFYAKNTGGSPTTYNLTVKKGVTTIATKSKSVSSESPSSFALSLGDYSELFESGDSFTFEITSSAEFTCLDSSVSFTGTYFSYSTNDAPLASSVATFQEYNNLETATIEIDANTTTLDGNEKGFAISVPDASIPTNTSITVTVGDGVNTLTAGTIDSVSKGVVIGNNGTLTSGTLELTFTLNTTDTSVTPTLPSYGSTILR